MRPINNLPRGLFKIDQKIKIWFDLKQINKNKLKIIYSNCEALKIGATKIPSEYLWFER